jgi:alcohol dehydrogenase
VHALEAYTAAVQPTSVYAYPGPVFRGKNAFSDLHALTAIRVIHGALERAVANGEDLEARAMMLFGSLSAGIAFGHAGTAGATHCSTRSGRRHRRLTAWGRTSRSLRARLHPPAR